MNAPSPASIGMRDWVRANPRTALQIGLSTLLVYGLCWPIVAPDLPEFFYPWIDHILTAGRIKAFAVPFSNYTPPYLYLLSAASLVTHNPLAIVKSLALLSVLAAAFAVRRLIGQRPFANEAALLLLLLPSVMTNAAIYGQCDGYWAAACVMATVSAADARPRAMLIWFGLGLAFKLQAIFLAPFVLVMLLRHRPRLIEWPIPLAIYALAMLPAWLAGWPAADLATIYLRQGAYFNTIGTAPGPWAIVAAFHAREPLAIFALGYAAAAIAAVSYVAVFARRRLDPLMTMRIALLSAMTIPYLLPKMHERYLLLADLLSFAIAVIAHDRRSAQVFVACQLASTIAIFGAMFDFLYVVAASAVPATLAIALLLLQLRADAAEQSQAGTRQR
jgi:Gpi18-like mannosyltransferase